jgi:N-formylglutamate deformylase
MEPFSTLPPSGPPAPVVAHVPHSGTHIPAEVRDAILLDDHDLAEEVRRLTDHRTDVLAEGARAAGATCFVNRWSRLVVDPERFTDPDQEEMERVGMGAVYTATSDGRPLRSVTAGERAELLARHFEPYHRALTALVGSHLAATGVCAVLDVHSYPSAPLPYELHGADPRPELCVGTDRVHTPGWLREIVTEVAGDHGLTVGFDVPFRGTFVPQAWLGDARVVSVMLEIRRDTYLDEASARPHAGEDRLRTVCREVTVAMAARLGADGG